MRGVFAQWRTLAVRRKVPTSLFFQVGHESRETLVLMTGKKLQESRALHGWGLFQTVGDRAEVSLGEPGNLAGYSGSVQSPGLHLSPTAR